MGLDCTGSSLPGKQTLKVSSSEQLDDFCNTIDSGDEILLYEQISSGIFYWIA